MKIISHIVSVVLLVSAFSSCEGQKVQSDSVAVRLEEVGLIEHSQKVLAMQFTSVGCTGCPAMSEAVKVVQAENPDVLIPMSIHTDYGNVDDPMDISSASLFLRRYGVEALPEVIFNFRESSADVLADKYSVAAAMRKELSAGPASCGVSIKTSYDGQAKGIKVDLGIATNVEMRFRYHIFIVEDGIKGIQYGASDTQNYTHDNVVRRIVSSDIYGKNLNDKRPVPAGHEAVVTERIPVEDGWNVENLRVIAAAMVTEDGNTWTCANSNQCAVGESVDYVTSVSKYVKHIAVMEFTGTWCAFCPQGYNNMNFVISRNQDYVDRVHVMAFHSDEQGEDPMALDAADQIRRAHKFESLGFPSYLIDMRESGPLVGETYEQKESFRQSLSRIFNEVSADCAIAMSSKVNDNTAEVEVRLTSDVADAYRVAVFVVEDGVVARQNVSSVINDKYVHDHVVRKVVTASYNGESVGRVEKDDEIKKTYKVVLDSAWNLEHTYIYALAIDSDNFVDNMNLCAVNGGQAFYTLKQ